MHERYKNAATASYSVAPRRRRGKRAPQSADLVRLGHKLNTTLESNQHIGCCTIALLLPLLGQKSVGLSIENTRTPKNHDRHISMKEILYEEEEE